MRFTLCLAALLSVPSVSAQADWRPVPDGAGISVDALLARESGTVGFTDPTGAPLGSFASTQTFAILGLSARVPLAGRLTALASVPAALYDLNVAGTTVSEEPFGTGLDTSPSVGLGNPYVGLAVALAPEASVEAGVYLPLSTDKSSAERRENYDTTVGDAGGVTDIEHYEAYLDETVSGRLKLSGRAPLSPAIAVRGHLAPVLSYYTGEVSARNPDGTPVELDRTNLAASGGAFLDGRLGAVVLTGGAVGRFDPRDGTLVFIDTFRASALVGVAVEGFAVRPGLLVRVPVVGAQFADAIASFSLDVPFR